MSTGLSRGHVLDVNPAHAVRGPKCVVKKCETPVLNADGPHVDSIKIAKKTEDDEGAETEEPALVGSRDRALISVMVYTFASVNAVLQMKVRFVQVTTTGDKMRFRSMKSNGSRFERKYEQAPLGLQTFRKCR